VDRLRGILRDLTWFLPITRRLYKRLLVEQEVACDDRVTGEPRRLALASALARVWQAELGAGLARVARSRSSRESNRPTTKSASTG